MKPQDLRIGNWVYRWNGLTQIRGIDLQELEDEIKAKEVTYSPIPLTPEWLERFGFENYDYGAWKLGEFLIDQSGGAYPLYIKGQFDNTLATTIVYVHQLQNLYFALTGEELETK